MDEYFDAPNGFQTQEHVFESGHFSIIVDYDNYLRTVYGDYMTLPPEDARHAHDMQVFAVD